MYIQDAARVVAFGSFFSATVYFFYLSWTNRNNHADDAIIQQHFMEHALAASFALLGSLVGTVWSTVHMLSLEQGTLPEYPFSTAIVFLLISGMLFMLHMIKEQTVGHPYYQREMGEDNIHHKSIWYRGVDRRVYR